MIGFDGASYQKAERLLPEEAAIAISVGGSTHAVMMATPHDLEDFAFGFLYTAGVIDKAEEIEDLQIEKSDLGYDLQTRLVKEKSEQYQVTKRQMAGPVGCGLCGVESLALAFPELQKVKQQKIDENLPWQALETLSKAQKNREISGAIHGAALLDLSANLVHAREDIGRHNAMDKVIGAALREGIGFEDKLIVLSSRVSSDLVIKAVRAGIGTLIACATPSDLAFTQSVALGLQLIAPVFPDEYFKNG